MLFVYFVLMRVGPSTERLVTLPANMTSDAAQSRGTPPRRAQRLAAELIERISGGDRREDRRLDAEGGLA